MNPTQILVVALFLVPMLAVIAGWLRMDVAALVIMASLAVMQYAGLGVFGPVGAPEAALHALSGFGQPAMIVLVCLFIITSALEKSGFSNRITYFILKLGGDSTRRMLVLFTTTAALLSQVMNNVAAGALLIPSALEAARRTGIKPSKLLIPVSFGSLLGGMSTYFTTANILADNLLQVASPPQPSLGILSFAPTGGLILLSGLAFMAVFGDRLLVDRETTTASWAQRPTGSELEELYRLGERTWQVEVLEGSPLAGSTLLAVGLGENYGLTLTAIRRGANNLFFPNPEMIIRAKDRLLVIGREERIQLLAGSGVRIQPEQTRNQLSRQGISVFELLVTPRSTMIGKTLKELDFRRQFGWSAIALQRGSRSYRTDVGELHLSAGDSLLVVGESSRRDALKSSRDFILLEPNPADQPMRSRETALSLGLLLAAIVATLFGAPIYLSMLIAALLIILSGAISMQEAYEAIEWHVIFVMGGMYSLSQAMVQTGMAETAGQWMTHFSDFFGPLGLAGGAFLISALLTQVMGGQVTILITGPVAISAAIGLGVNPQAIAVAAAIGCSASFLTPLSHPVNLLVVVPGGYTFRDFFRIGWRLFLISFAALLAGMVLFWGL